MKSFGLSHYFPRKTQSVVGTFSCTHFECFMVNPHMRIYILISISLFSTSLLLMNNTRNYSFLGKSVSIKMEAPTNFQSVRVVLRIDENGINYFIKPKEPKRVRI